MKNLDTRSGEILSAFLGIAIAVSLFLSPNMMVFQALDQAGAIPWWPILSIFCSLISLVSAFVKNCRVQAFSRFLSGCVWGTLALIYAAIGQTHIIFWTALVLFAFDILVVIFKGRHQWIQKRGSLTRNG